MYSYPQAKLMNQVWRPTLAGMVKLNSNAAFNSMTDVASLGMVLRDEQETVLLIATGSINFVPSSLYAEVLAILFGLKPTLENSFLKMIVESDALVAIDMIGKGDLRLWEGGCLLHDIHDLAATCAVSSFNFIMREMF
ncbi:hypothetical protein CRYUN_Cryun12cG0120300 [Craigia yunnanensis]